MSQTRIEELLQSLDKILQIADKSINDARLRILNGKTVAQEMDRYTVLQDQIFGDETIMRTLENFRISTADPILQRRTNRYYQLFQKKRFGKIPEVSKARLLVWQETGKIRYKNTEASHSIKAMKQIMTLDPSRDEREQAWQALSACPAEVLDALRNRVRVENQAASKFGYENYLDMIQQWHELPEWNWKIQCDRFRVLTNNAFEKTRNGLMNQLQVTKLMPWDLDRGVFEISQRIDTLWQMEAAVPLLRNILIDLGWKQILPHLEIKALEKNAVRPVEIVPDLDHNILLLFHQLIPGRTFYRLLFSEMGSWCATLLCRKVPWSLIPIRSPRCWLNATLFESLLSDQEILNIYAHQVGVSDLPDAVPMTTTARLRNLGLQAQLEREMYLHPDDDWQTIANQLYSQYRCTPEGWGGPWWIPFLYNHSGGAYIYAFLFEVGASQLLEHFDRRRSLQALREWGDWLLQTLLLNGETVPWAEAVSAATSQPLDVENLVARLDC